MLSRRYFRRMWAVTTISSLGDWLGVFALTLFVQRLSGRPEFAVGGVLLFRVLPGLFFGPVAGVLADRFDRRRLMVTADICRAALISSIPWIHNLWVLFLVSSMMEVLALLWTPAKDATLPNLVERDQLMMANQLSLITTYGTFPIAGGLVALLAGLAGLLGRIDAFSIFEKQPMSLAFFIDAATFLFSAAMVASFPIHLTKTRRPQDTKFNAMQGFLDLAEGLRFVRRHQVIRALVGGAWVAFTGGSAVISLGPIFARDVTGGGATAAAAAWGVLIVAVGIGLVSGMVTAGLLSRKLSRERIFPAGLALSGASVIGVASMSSMVPAVAFTVFVGLGAGLAWVTIFTLLQERTDERLRGRTFATLYTGIQLSLFLGLAGWPFLAAAIGNHTAHIGGYSFDLSGVRVALWGGGVFLMVAGVMAGRSVMPSLYRRAKVPRMRGLHFSPAPIGGGARQGFFVAFEGVEGAGKSTQVKLLHDALVADGRLVVVTREPGGAPIAERIRAVLLDPAASEMDPKTEALLYAAARAQHATQIIRPALERGAVVICDRYIDSSLAYQGHGRGLGEDDVLRLNIWATDELLPDLVVLLHVDPEIGMSRTKGDPDRIEQEDIAFHRTVADAFLQLARAYPSRFAVVDSSQPPEQVHAQVMAAILPFVRTEHR